MAKKKNPSLTNAARKRLKKLPGSARNYLDPKTGAVYSRRQYEKGRVKIPRKNAEKINYKYKQYLRLRDIYIETERAKGKKVSKRQAMKKIGDEKWIKNIHSKDSKIKKRALQKIGVGQHLSKKDWEKSMKYWDEKNAEK